MRQGTHNVVLRFIFRRLHTHTQLGPKTVSSFLLYNFVVSSDKSQINVQEATLPDCIREVHGSRHDHEIVSLRDSLLLLPPFLSFLWFLCFFLSFLFFLCLYLPFLCFFPLFLYFPSAFVFGLLLPYLYFHCVQ